MYPGVTATFETWAKASNTETNCQGLPDGKTLQILKPLILKVF
jgi:hypothetical protein